MWVPPGTDPVKLADAAVTYAEVTEATGGWLTAPD
jgi:hypothetical protein